MTGSTTNHAAFMFTVYCQILNFWLPLNFFAFFLLAELLVLLEMY